LFATFQKSLRPARNESELVQGILLLALSSLRKSRFDPDFVLFYAFSGKMVIQKKTKKFFFNHSQISA
jgi:hypothetical protein